ncbi:MAG: DNA repair protein RecN [Candidatus Hydrogenedentes bacterium]|nr:DNA repair protein RecN [Candidatus Hydrogenedentota bacterium]
MLEVFQIRNYALIDALDIEFQPGFNAITGETGAGKSILVGALGLALGARASADSVRNGAEHATVEAVFRVVTPSQQLTELLLEAGVSLDDDLLILSRTVSSDGRSRAQVNGKLVTITTLAAIGDELVDLHGQHEHQSLLRVECQLALLDAFSGTTEAAQTLSECMTRLNKIQREIEAFESDDRDHARQADFLRYEISEIDAAALTPLEEKELRSRLHLINHAENIYTLANTAYNALYESELNAAIDSIDSALNALDDLSEIDAQFTALRTQVAEGRACIENAAEDLRAHTCHVEFDPNELDTVNARLSLIGDLKRKYGSDITAVLAYRDKAKATLAGYENHDETLDTMRAAHKSLFASTMKKAKTLSRQRKKAAKDMDTQVMETLQSLDMRGARFSTQIETTSLCGNGIDKVAFMLSANTGEALKPLRLVASGGEISRIMLALKSVFADQDPVSTLIFDEIDAGIGGATARRIAEKMVLLSTQRQVLCITHLAQIAAPATAHYAVIKFTEDGRTGTRIERLNGKQREQEIARLLDGSVSTVSLKHARALLAESTCKVPKKKKGSKKQCVVDL